MATRLYTPAVARVRPGTPDKQHAWFTQEKQRYQQCGVAVNCRPQLPVPGPKNCSTGSLPRAAFASTIWYPFSPPTSNNRASNRQPAAAALEQQSGRNQKYIYASCIAMEPALVARKRARASPSPSLQWRRRRGRSGLSDPAVGVGASTLGYQKRAGLNTRSPHRPNTHTQRICREKDEKDDAADRRTR